MGAHAAVVPEQSLGVGMNDQDARKSLGEWASKHGIDFASVGPFLEPGDAECAIEQLRYAREQKSYAEVECVLFWLRIVEERARNQS